MRQHQIVRVLRVNILLNLLSPDFQVCKSQNYLRYNLPKNMVKKLKFWYTFERNFCASYLIDCFLMLASFLALFWYLRYKQQLFKMCQLRHRLRIFLFHRKVKFCCWDIQVFVFLTITRFTKSVTSWWVLVHETGCIFE